MADERLRAAILGAGITQDILGHKIGVDPRTVERWISTDRIPHRTHRLAAGAALGKDEVYLWPATESDARAMPASQAEVVAVHPTRGSIPITTWVSLVERAEEHIDLLAYAASFLHDAVPDFDRQLAVRAKQGVCVRLLFGDPKGHMIDERGCEEGIDDLLAASCRLTWSYFKPALAEPNVWARMHDCTLYNSLFRFDDTILVNTHIFGAAASHSSLLHLQRIPGGRLFDNYLLGFDRTWERARDVEDGRFE